MEELLSLKWNNHRSTFLHILTILRDKQLYTDATLACDGRFYSVHRLVLSTCSDYFCAMFDKTTTCKNPIIVLKDIKCEDLEALLDYMYLGEVNVRQADLASLIKSAECLRVKGLAVPDDEPPKKSSKENSRRSERGQSPPSKRKRLEDQDGRESVRPSGNRSKSPLSHSRLSPFTSQSASDDQDRLSPSQSTSERLGNATSNDAPKVKVEVIDDPSDEMGGSNSFNLQNDGFKEEADDTDPGGGGLPDDLPDFLQDSNSSYSQSYAGPSSFQPDLQSWQGDQVLSGNYSDLGFGPSQSQDGSQNTSGNANNTSRIEESASGSYPQADRDFDQESGSVFGLRSPRLNLNLITPQNMNLLHAKERLCPACLKFFPGRNWRQDLIRHFRIHTGEKPFECPYCPHKTNMGQSLKKHISSKHGPDIFSQNL